MSNESRVIVTCMKNECPYILEWIAYHMEIGFTHFVVATNGCADGTVRLLRALESAGIVTNVPNPPPHHRGPQKTGYVRCRGAEAVLNADWLMTLDVDEYLSIYTGEGRIDDLLAAAGEVTPGANMVSLQWLMFGHNGNFDFEDVPVMKQFTRCAKLSQMWPMPLRSFKTLYRADLYQRLGTHRPNFPVEANRDKIRWVNGSGHSMPEAYIDRGWAGQRDGQGLGSNLARINHYAVRSLDSFLIKRDRGDVNPGRNHAKTQDGLAYWEIHDWNMVEDLRILRLLPRVQARMEELKKLPRVARIHDVGVQWHKRKATELRDREDMADLHARILEIAPIPRTVQDGWLVPEGAGQTA